eukprot:1056226-Prymnesium_polylepis.1
MLALTLLGLLAQPNVVHLVGITPGQRASHLMGTYTIRAVWVNGHPSYSRDRGMALWWAEGIWCAGRAELMGQRQGALVSERSTQEAPAGVKRWFARQADGGVAVVPTAQCVAGDDGAAVAASEAQQLEQALSRLPRTIYVVATTHKLDRVRRTFCGAYNAQRSRRVNNRLVYVREGSTTGGKAVSNSTKVVWQAGGGWFVGVAKYLGQQAGAMLAVLDSALGPEQARRRGAESPRPPCSHASRRRERARLPHTHTATAPRPCDAAPRP